MLGNKESLDQIIVATPGLSSDPVALGESRCDPEDLRKAKQGESVFNSRHGEGRVPLL